VAPPSADRNPPRTVATSTWRSWNTTSLIVEVVASTSRNVAPASVDR
jgi:hypothetical protein